MSMHQPKQTARLAGFLYLALAITGAFGIMYIPGRIMVPLDVAATVKNIVDHQLAFRLSIASHMVSQIFFIFLGLALYRLFRDVDAKNSRLMIALILVAVVIALLNTLNQVAALHLALGQAVVFDRNQLDAMTMFFLNLGNDGTAIAQIFWGLWLFPFGLIAIRSGLMQKWIGYLLIVACLSYVANSTAHFLMPGYAQLATRVAAIAGTAAEISAILWLLIKGVNEIKTEAPPPTRKS